MRKNRRCRYSFPFSFRRVSMKLKTFAGCLYFSLLVLLSTLLFLFLCFLFIVPSLGERNQMRNAPGPTRICLSLTRCGGCRLISRWLIKNSFVFVTGTDGTAHLCLFATSRNEYTQMERCKRWNARLQSKVSSAYTKEILTIKFIGKYIGKFDR